MFAALEFDHDLFKPQIKWIVVECSGVGRKCGGPIAYPPRRDRAYFISPASAREDAEAYADFKNRQAQDCLNPAEQALVRRAQSGESPRHHFAYPWDHLLLAAQPLTWAVFEWSGDDTLSSPRVDAAYFTLDDEAERDARIFAFLRERDRFEETLERKVDTSAAAAHV